MASSIETGSAAPRAVALRYFDARANTTERAAAEALA
jgi:hypothetical protein